MDFSAAELTNMRTTQTGHMMDTCKISVQSASVDSFGQMVETWTDGSEMDCGLDMRPSSERRGANYTATEYDATLRLAITAAITSKDRVSVTKRFGETLGTALVFEVVSPIQRGPSGIRVLLRRVEV